MKTAMTREGLKELRGLIFSIITSNTKLREVWDEAFLHPSWLHESVTRIVTKGYVTNIGQFMTRFNRWMQNPPKKFTAYQMQLLEHVCGCPQYEFEALPFYCALNPEPDGMTPAEGGAANRKHTEAWSRFCRETERLMNTFGDDDMCNDFDNQKTAYLTESTGGLNPMPDGATRIVFLSMKTFIDEMKMNVDKWDEVTWSIQKAVDGKVVVDVLPLVVNEERAA